MKVISFVLAILLLKSAESALPTPTESYPNKLVLRDPDVCILYWSYDDYNIKFELHVKNSVQQSIPADIKQTNPNVQLKSHTWVMFGIRNDNVTLPIQSDFIVSWLSSQGFGHFSDRNSLANTFKANIDESTDWIPVDAKSVENYTIIKFTRTIPMCAELNKEDLSIPLGQATVLFALGNLYENNDIFGPVVEYKTVELIKQNGQAYACPIKPAEPKIDTVPTAYYANSDDLVPGAYRLYWNYTDTDLIAEIHCKTQGWVSFGLSPNGGMDKSDVVVGWVSNGTTFFTVCRLSNEHLVVKIP